jgi:hypothetical protein
MATHDYVIANASGAAVRTDLNNVLAAIVTNNSNATAPATTYAYQWWADTTATQLKLRNAANDDWIVIAEFDGTKLLNDGTAAAPGLAFVDDVDTGVFRPSANTFAVAVGGSEIARFDSSGRLLVGTTTARSNLFNGAASAALQVEGTETNDRAASIISSSSTAGDGARLTLGHQLSGTLGGNTVVSDDTDLGSVVFQGSDGSDLVAAAQIVAEIDGPPGANDMPGRLIFSTTADGASSPTERMRIDSAGVVSMQSDSAADQQSCQLEISGGGPSVVADQKYAKITFKTQDTDVSSAYTDRAEIAAVAENDHDSTNARTGIAFYTMNTTAASPAERMRINNDGQVFINLTSAISGSSSYLALTANGGSQYGITVKNIVSSGGTAINFVNDSDTTVGRITTTATNTAYNTSSDYRLKENIIEITDGINRVKLLQPKRFSFIADADKVVDGFIAHEAQTVVPEAVTGTRDEVDEDGNPVYQGIDQAKLVPLLTAALQEAIAKIEVLETKVAALEAAN